MKLFYAAGSPYARIVRVALREIQIDAPVEEIEVTLRDPKSALLPYNPGGKVPTLELDDRTILNESLLVLLYLDTRHSGRKLLPMDGSDGWNTLSRVGAAIAFLDGISVWNRELRFGLKAPGVIAAETARANRAADALEQQVASGGFSGHLDACQIVLGAALENAARRHKVWDWRTERPHLSGFLDTIAKRGSFTATLQPEINL
ncbi:MAG TPA: glutathione S-transferase family protein [Stellaceae bacterium]|nr:glutathione S-transferase family protein [Stellaceae bacterium]